MKFKDIKKQESGFAAIMSVLIISAIALLLAKNSATVGRIDLDAVNDAILLGIAKTNAESCVKEALYFLGKDNDFSTSSLGLNINNGECDLSLANDDPNVVLIATGRHYNHVYKCRVEALLVDDSINIKKWVKI